MLVSLLISILAVLFSFVIRLIFRRHKKKPPKLVKAVLRSAFWLIDFIISGKSQKATP